MEVRIERKFFQLNWTGIHRRSLLAISERERKRFSKCFLPKEGGEWVAEQMSLVAAVVAEDNGGGENKEVRGDSVRWRDHEATIVGTVVQNQNGRF